MYSSSYIYQNDLSGFAWLGIIAVLGVYVLIRVLYIMTLANTLKAISPENRAMPVGNVWLLLIPLFNIVWSFIVVNKLSQSILQETKVREFALRDANPANGVGIAMSTLSCITFIPILGSLAGLAAFICWIIYWTQISSYKKAIIAAPLKYKENDSLIFNY
ncbi:hypothetical protein DBR32_13265 [Taibaiella sp. KBW10]|uniref:hypothetical protein n=1 Tax=Taibaiella sp. KBW10 TaxID=2153357 RepID=UPI000F5A4344|nr:hypothetical protein [Taibaiella sp. KBW10]RQO30527.1 hypothetical protein DBR32_13265 [Taibaiella sp. KBW10]